MESPFGANVKTPSGYGVIVSVSKTHYGVKLASDEVVYFARALIAL